MNQENNKKVTIETQEQKVENNLQFVGKGVRRNKEENKTVKVRREAPTFIIDGRKKIDLPKDLDKGAAVDSDTAQRVKTLFPEDFKTPTAK